MGNTSRLHQQPIPKRLVEVHGRLPATLSHEKSKASQLRKLLSSHRSIFDAVRDFLQYEAFAGQENVMAKISKPDLLIIDDIGIKQLPRRSGEYLFEITMRRYETKSTIMTSNRPLEGWGKLLGDVPSATAILDRFLHHAEVITITDQSHRRKDRAGNSSAKGNKNPKR